MISYRKETTLALDINNMFNCTQFRNSVYHSKNFFRFLHENPNSKPKVCLKPVINIIPEKKMNA